MSSTRELTIARWRTGAAERLRRVSWPGPLGASVVAVVISLLVVVRTMSATDMFLTPDGGHYLADADALLGNGARELRHPPIFPALLALVRMVTGDLDAFVWTMALSLALVVVALFVLLRSWYAIGPSIVGAAAGGATPVFAELFAWGGGATLLGMAASVFTLAAMERWIQREGRWGIVVGVGLAVTALTHPFALALTVATLGVRWLVEAIGRRRFTTGWDVLGARGMFAVAAIAVPVFVAASTLYFGPGSSFGMPRFEVAWDLLRWALKDGVGGWLLAGAAAVGLALAEFRGVLAYGLTLFAFDIAFPAMLRGDVIYANRAEYVVPVVVALGIASLAGLIVHAVAGWRVTALVGVAAVGIASVLFATFLPRLDRAIGYYNVWITRDDARLLETLKGDEGVVATSWRAYDYGTGVNLSWLVEGVAERPALGAADAALASLTVQREGGSDMQRVFAGFHGIENDALQVAGAPPTPAGDLAVQIRGDGLAYPFLVVRSTVDRYPVDFATVRSELSRDSLVSTFRDRDGEVVMQRVAAIDGRVVTIDYRIISGRAVGAWSVALSPAPGMTWTRLRRGDVSVGGDIGIRSETVSFTVRADDRAVRLSHQEGSIRVTGTTSRSLGIRIATGTHVAPGDVRTFQERDLLRARAISDVIVMKNTGLIPRFEADPCFARSASSDRLVVYDVTSACSSVP